MDWTGFPVLIVGAARQGLALAAYLARCGASVLLNDARPEKEMLAEQATLEQTIAGYSGQVRWWLGGHPLQVLDGVKLVCLSGGVPLTLPLIVEAVRLGIPLSNDSQIFLEAVPCRVVGITGSAGKTTTTSVVGRIAERSVLFRKVWVGGNIGLPLITFVEEMQSSDLVVMELSSFQLEIMSESPDIAAILNITPNHLDRHETMEAYRAAKARIIENQSTLDTAILGRDDPGAWSLADHVHGRLFSFGRSELPGGEGTFYRDGDLFLRQDGRSEERIMNRASIRLRGDHNLLNVLAACAISTAAGIPASLMEAGISDFTGVAHRLEFVRRWGGADWYNNSIATAPERTIAAIRSFDEPLVVLLGGRDKKLPWDELARLVWLRVDHLIVFGEAAEIILSAVEQASPEAGADEQFAHAVGEGSLTIAKCNTLAEAVSVAASIVQPGDVVLLSPGGTSFDEFRDFEERGACFAQWVNELV
jgi:UDP-N-acetylmuramoylalanine--D-glutamate ligase